MVQLLQLVPLHRSPPAAVTFDDDTGVYESFSSGEGRVFSVKGFSVWNMVLPEISLSSNLKEHLKPDHFLWVPY